MASCTVTIKTKITPDEKAKFNEITSELGLSPSVALRMFIRKFNDCGGFPFEVRQDRTREDFIEANESRILKPRRGDDGTPVYPSDWRDDEGDVYDKLYGNLA